MAQHTSETVSEEIIARDIYARLTGVIDPELGKSIVELGMVTKVSVCASQSDNTESNNSDNLCAYDDTSDNDHCYQQSYDAYIQLELTVPHCPLSSVIQERISNAIESYPDADVTLHLSVGAMAEEKLNKLVSDLKAARHDNPFHTTRSDTHKTRIFAVASGKGGVGKSSVTVNLAATYSALGYDTAIIDADIYGFSVPRLMGVASQPTNLNGMLMPVEAWGVKVMSIGMFAGADQAILWRGPRLQRSLEQFLSDVWWGEPDVLIIDMPPGTGDMAISVAQALPNAELIIVTTPQISASDIAVRSGLVALQLPMDVAGVIENMSWYDHAGERLEIFGSGGGQRVASQLTEQLHDKIGHDITLLGQIPLQTTIRETAENGRPVVLNSDGTLADHAVAQTFKKIIEQLNATAHTQS